MNDMSDINDCNSAIDNMHTSQCANRENPDPGYKHEDTNSGFSSYCKIDSRTDAATLIAFDSLKHVTKEDNTEAGAILIEIAGQEYWLPKRLCSNMDLDVGTVYVWTKFLESAKPELLDMISDE